MKSPTQSELSKRLHVSRQAVSEWRRRFKETAPKGNDYEEWKTFISDNGLGVVGNRVSKERESIMTQLNQRKLRLADLEIARKEGKMVLRSDMDSRDVAIFTRQKAVLFAALESEYPGKVVGRTAAEIRVLGKDLAIRICEIFSKDLENWQWTSEHTKI